MKFAFILMGDFQLAADRACIRNGAAQIVGVSSLQEAAAAAQQLLKEGVGCIELCGADGARAIVKATGNQIPVGYITHLPEQEEVYKAAFSG